jgi:hypothetical protein
VRRQWRDGADGVGELAPGAFGRALRRQRRCGRFARLALAIGQGVAQVAQLAQRAGACRGAAHSKPLSANDTV